MFHLDATLDEIQTHDHMMTDKEFLEREITRFKVSSLRRDMLNGKRYYEGKHDILLHKRQAIGADGDLVEIKNLPNNRIIDNQYKKMVDQKTNYLLGKPITFTGENTQYIEAMKKFFNRRFLRQLKNVGKSCINEGICWLYPMYNERGEFCFKTLYGHEVDPLWKDAEHTELEGAIRLYLVPVYEPNKDIRLEEKVEIFDDSGIWYFHLDGNSLVAEEPFHQSYFMVDDEGYNWERIPLIAFKRDASETPLIKCVKSLQDGLNLILSNFQNNMEEDSRNTILILVNYDGENLGTFRQNLATYGAVKVKTVDGAAGDLKTLQVEVNAENYKAILEIFKKAIIENAMGYDAKDDRLSGNPNQMNIQSMYSDIDLDANEMETEFQAAFEELLWFVKCHLHNAGIGDYTDEEVDVIFNRDILINETEVITNIQNSAGILSDETLISNHPWVDDPQDEIRKVKEQNKDTTYPSSFLHNHDHDSDGTDKDDDE